MTAADPASGPGDAGPAPAATPADEAVSDAFLRALPKAELHVHLEGSLAPATLLALAEKHRLHETHALPRTLDEVRDWYAFRDFDHFVDVYLTAVHALRDEEDFALLASETGKTLAAQGVRYAEVTFTPYLHTARGIPAAVVFAGYERGRRQAEAEHGVRLRWIIDFPGHMGADVGELSLDTALAAECEAVIGFGVGGIEVDRRQFAPAFARARAAGLRSVPHAGETTGPASVWSAIDDLGAERVGHGIASAQDPALLSVLRDRQIWLEVCPTSNLRTRAVGSLAEHPLAALVAAGVPVTIASDDPPMFSTTLLAEYRVACQLLGLDATGAADLARASFRASFLPEADVRGYLAEIDALPGVR